LNDVVALDAATGRAFWIYRIHPPRIASSVAAPQSGLGILATPCSWGLDAQLIAIDRRTGRAIWKTEVATDKSRYSITHAPLVVKNKVIVGVGGGDTASGASSRLMTPRPDAKRGGSTPSPRRVNPVPRRGSAVLPRPSPSAILRLETWWRFDLDDRLYDHGST
jgi:outer membrane protein assembly factor BamB